MTPQPRILVIRGGAIGDFILTLPVLAALREQFPQTRIEVLGYPHIVQLALAGGLADEVRSIEARPLAGFFARGGVLDPGLQEYFAGFALIISYLYDPDRIFQMNVARCSKAQFIVGPHRPDEMGGAHAAEVYLRPLERLAIFQPDIVPRLSLAAKASHLAARGISTHVGAVDSKPEASPSASEDTCAILAAHPGSGSERKNWPETKWAGLLQQIVEKSELNLLIVGGEAEEGKLERLAAPLPGERVQIVRSLPLTELAQRLAGCVGFIGHDSGISHLAAAVGLPALILWGESVEVIWRPQGDRITIIRDAAGLPALSVDCVANALRNLLG
jgi:heptosyltransferase III